MTASEGTVVRPFDNVNVGDRITVEMLTYLPEDVLGGYLTQADIDYMKQRYPGGGETTLAPGSTSSLDTGNYASEYDYPTYDTAGIDATFETPTSTYDDGPIRVSRQRDSSSQVAAANAAASEANQQSVVSASSAVTQSTEPLNPPNASDNNPIWQNFYKEVSGRHNLLHDFNTYTYNISLVAISKAQLEDPSLYKGRVTGGGGAESDSYYIVAKSGGFTRTDAVTDPVSDFDGAVGVQQYKGAPGQRDYDLFIDNVVFETRAGINDQGNSNITQGTFDITEPHGVAGFYRELFAGSKFAGHENYIGAPFLLIISFKGRRKEQPDEAVVPEQTTRYIPILIRASEMSVDEGGARYTVSFMGYNSVGASVLTAAMWGEIEPTVITNRESVESVLYSSFYLNHEAHQKVLDAHEEELSATQKSELNERIANREVITERFSQASSQNIAQNAKNNVGMFMAHKYYVWFARDHVGFPSKVSEFDTETWTNHVKSFVNNSSFTGTTSLGGSLTNDFGEASLADDASPQSGLLIDDYETAMTAYDERRQTAIRERNNLKSSFNSEVETYNGLLESLAQKEAAQRGVPEADRETDLAADVNINPRTQQTVIEQKIDEGNKLARTLTTGILQPGPASAPPLNNRYSTDELAEIVALRDKIIELGNKIKGLQPDILRLDQEIADIEADAGDLGRQTWDLGNSNVKWAFKKGTNLATAIDIIIKNSTAMSDLVKDETLTTIKNTEMIPWYKTDIYTKIIGFDVVTMDFVYDIHYVVSPFDIHYSKMPGVNIIFSTKKSRERAVREYNYIYSGKNLDVLRFDIKYNNLFKTPMLLSPPNAEALGSREQLEAIAQTYIDRNNMQEVTDRIANAISNKLGDTGFTPAQTVDNLNYRSLTVSNRNNIGVALQEFLYNPPFEQALIRSELEIVGDPVYIVGSGISDRPIVNPHDILTPDGEINTFTREPDVILNFRYPEDIPTYAELQNRDVPQFEQNIKKGDYSGLYQVVKIENRFSEGMFTQNLTLLRRKNQEEDFTVDEVQDAIALNQLTTDIDRAINRADRLERENAEE